jgi:hypothetical protein
MNDIRIGLPRAGLRQNGGSAEEQRHERSE